MRAKSLKNAKLIVRVTGYKEMQYNSKNCCHYTIKTDSIFDNRTQAEWTKERIHEREIEHFLNVQDLKETLNWNLNGDDRKYQFTWGQSGAGKTDGIAYIFD